MLNPWLHTDDDNDGARNVLFVTELLLQAALHDPLLSLSSQLHRSSARRRTHTGESFQALSDLWNATEMTEKHFFFFSYLLLYLCLSASQVAVTAVAMTFDKDQTQEKPPDKPITKGL